MKREKLGSASDLLVINAMSAEPSPFERAAAKSCQELQGDEHRQESELAAAKPRKPAPASGQSSMPFNRPTSHTYPESQANIYCHRNEVAR